MFGKSNVAQKSIETLIGAKAVLTGDLEFAGGLRIDGKIKGNVVSAAAEASFVVVSELATIEGSIKAAHVIVNGAVVGPIEADLLELQPKARITGNVQYRTVEMHNGAVVEGMFQHVDGRPDLKLLAGGAN